MPSEFDDSRLRQLLQEQSADPPVSARALGERIRSSYPYPIAAPYFALADQGNDAARLGCLISTFAGLVHYLAAVAVSAYLRTDLADADCNARILQLLGKPAWSTGDLLGLLRDTVRLGGDCQGLLPYAPLPGYLFTAHGKPTVAQKVLNEFVELRNLKAHRKPVWTEADCARVVPLYLQLLQGELARMAWLGECQLIRPVAIDEGGRVTSADLLNGSTRWPVEPFSLQLHENDLPRAGGIVWADRNTLLLVGPDGQEYLPLFPLTLFRLPGPGAGVYLVQGFRWRTTDGGSWRLEQAKYVAYQEGLPEHKEGAGELAAQALEKQVARLQDRLPESAVTGPAAPPAEDPDCELPEVRLEQESHRRWFVGREEMLGGLAGWIDGKAEGGYLLLLGPPGQGKSALMAELAHREGQRGGCLLHMVKAHGQPLRFLPALIRQAGRLAETSFGADAYRGDVEDLRNSLVRALEAVRGRGRAVVVIDALDELDTVGKRVTFLPQVLPAGVRVILTCRPDIPLVMALRARLRGHLEEQGVPPLREEDFRLFLERRLGAETAHALGQQVDLSALFRRLGGNPLFLHVFADDAARKWVEAAGQGETPRIDVAAVPASLDAVFHEVYNRIRASEGATRDGTPNRTRARLLQFLCVAREPLAIEQLSSLLAADGQAATLEDCRDRVEEMSQWLLDTGEGRYKPWHQGLTDYIRARVLGEAGCRAVEEVFCRWLEAPLGETGLYGLRHRPGHLLAAGRFDPVCDLLSDLRFLETKAEAGLVFELAGDYSSAVARLPWQHPRRRLLRLLEEAVRTDLHFLARHPSCLFQCLWNRCWWYDCPDAARHYDPPERGWPPEGPPWERPGPKLYLLLEKWRGAKEQVTPGFVWLRALRPPEIHLGTGQRAIFRGHEGPVWRVAFSPDGARLASASQDKTVRLWDAATGGELACLRGRGGAVYSVTFSPDGARLASASHNGSVRLWDAATGTELACLCGHWGGVSSVAFTPDGARLASASSDWTVRLWDATTGGELACLGGHEGSVCSVAFSPDGARLASGSLDGTVRLWDAATGAELACLGGYEGPVWSVAFTPDGARLASASDDKTVRLWDVARGEELARLRGHEGPVWSVAFSPDGTRLASASKDRTVRLWDAASGQELACLRGHECEVNGLAFSPDGGLAGLGVRR